MSSRGKALDLGIPVRPVGGYDLRKIVPLRRGFIITKVFCAYFVRGKRFA